VVGDSARALAVSERLRDAGLHVPAIRPPTVARGHARLRVALSAQHAECDVERLLDALAIAMDASRARGDEATAAAASRESEACAERDDE
jgi:hypothetical protein